MQAESATSYPHILSPLCAGGHWWATQVAKQVSDPGNQHNNGPHQDQISDKPSALCLVLRDKIRIQLQAGPMHQTGSLWKEERNLSFFIPPPPNQIWSTCNASTINYLITCCFSTLQPKNVTKLKRTLALVAVNFVSISLCLHHITVWTLPLPCLSQFHSFAQPPQIRRQLLVQHAVYGCSGTAAAVQQTLHSHV